MRRIDKLVETALDPSTRVKQLSGMFDVPVREKLSHRWQGDLPLDAKPWSIGLIVGPSGSGKSTLLRELFGSSASLTWNAAAVIDDFDAAHSIEDIANICQAVGFNTIPSWMKPYAVLSTGERFRVEVARRMLETDGLVAIDEFTSVVDRQVAQIGSHAVQKYIRKHPGRQLVAASCHFDIIDWLQPDWILEPATMTFQWRAVQRRPALEVEIARVDYAAWNIFAPFHYLTREMHRAAQCFVLFVRGQPASFISILNIPHPIRKNLRGISRAVTLPDYQGMGLVMILESKVCGAYRTFGIDVHGFPAHPPHIRSLDRSPDWKLIKKPGFSSLSRSYLDNLSERKRGGRAKYNIGKQGGRPCAVFEFVGAPLDRETATKLLGMENARQAV